MVNKFSRSCQVAVAVLAAAMCVAAGVLWSVAGGQAEPASPASQGNCPNTAAASQGWGAPNRSFDFASAAELDDWWLYDGPGHAGNGRRTPAAISVADGLVTITGDDVGNSGGMAPKGPGQIHGRWEVCIKSPPSAPTYHSVLLLWPDAEDWPVGGEIDFMEIADPTRQTVEAYLHYGPDDLREGGSIQIDAGQWHSWAVEWTPTRITTYVDGVQWWETTDAAHFPPRRMHLAMQLDDFGGDTRGGGEQFIDWAHEYVVG